MKRVRSLAILSTLLCAVAVAQSAPNPLPGYSVEVTAGYSALVGGTTAQGLFSSATVPLKTYDKPTSFTVAATGKYFLTTKEISVIAAGPEVRFQFSKPNLLNGEVFQPFVNATFGAARSECGTSACPSSSTDFAATVGGGLDMPEGSMLTWRIFEVDYIHSKIFPGNSLTYNNFSQVTTGLGLRF